LAESEKKLKPKKLVTFSSSSRAQQKESEKKEDKNIKKIPAKPLPEKIRYSAAGESLLGKLKSDIPKELIPTKLSGYFIMTLFLISLLIAILYFPLDKLLSGDPNLSINVGWPFEFFRLGIANVKKNPLVISGLLLDLLIYSVIAWGLEILYNYTIKYLIKKAKEDPNVRPVIFKQVPPVEKKVEPLAAAEEKQEKKEKPKNKDKPHVPSYASKV